MLERARAAGVTTLLAIGTGPGPEKLDAALPFAEAHEWIYTTVGIHPHEARVVTLEHLDELVRLAGHPKVIAWGEIGLDYFYDHSPQDVQERVFRDQMALAAQAKLPIMLSAWHSNLAGSTPIAPCLERRIGRREHRDWRSPVSRTRCCRGRSGCWALKCRNECEGLPGESAVYFLTPNSSPSQA